MNNVKLECNRHHFDIDQRYCVCWNFLVNLSWFTSGDEPSSVNIW